ncbi:MAG TPA: UvrD-helicase domain-containing protein [Planctomycetota bacterium]
MSKILSDLNEPQREAVETLQGPLLILAGAGSGKTRVVTRRIANLIAHGVRPWQILAITFTNKAAAEMRRRVDEMTGEQSGAWLSTFHSFCARILRREAEVLGYTRDFTIYDEDDASGVIKDIVKRLGLAEDKRFAPRQVRQEISALKSQATGSGDVAEGMFHERLLKKVYQEYEAELKKNNALDFDDLLRLTVVLFTEHPDVLERYRARFNYVLVDEYQDTNRCQYLLVKLLGETHRNVCATGDPDQSIYAWRGADVRNILSFERDFPEAKTVKLEQNYRSTQRILAAAGSVIEHNKERKPKGLWTSNPEGSKITLTVTGDEQLEAYEVVRNIEQLVRDGRRYNDFAVFFRTNAQSRPFETALLQAAIPYQLVGGTAFYERREVKDALAYLRLIVNPKDDVSFRRVINVPKRGLGDSAVELIEKHALELGSSLLETLTAPDADDFFRSFKPKPRQGLIEFVRLIDELRAMPQYPVEKVLSATLERSGLKESLLTADENERVENLQQLVNAAAEFDREYDPQNTVPNGPPPEPGAYDGMEEFAQRQASVAGFLENSALLAPTDNYDPFAERVTLMTLHMAKGLEFPVVFLTGMEDGLLPLLRMSEGENDRAIEEERRLVYVGMTRAREILHLSRVQFRRRFGQSDIALPSRFLKEIPQKAVELVDRCQPAWAQLKGPAFDMPKTKPQDDPAFAAFEKEVGEVFGDEQVVKRPPSSRRRDLALQTVVDRLLDTGEGQEDPDAYEIGDRIRHDDFGEGLIENITGSNLSRKVKVQFRTCGPKLLLLSVAMAKLRKL